MIPKCQYVIMGGKKISKREGWKLFRHIWGVKNVPCATESVCPHSTPSTSSNCMWTLPKKWNRVCINIFKKEFYSIFSVQYLFLLFIGLDQLLYVALLKTWSMAKSHTFAERFDSTWKLHYNETNNYELRCEKSRFINVRFPLNGNSKWHPLHITKYGQFLGTESLFFSIYGFVSLYYYVNKEFCLYTG